MEQIFIKRAIELIKEIKEAKEDREKKIGQLEGYLTGALEIFSLAEKQNGKQSGETSEI